MRGFKEGLRREKTSKMKCPEATSLQPSSEEMETGRRRRRRPLLVCSSLLLLAAGPSGTRAAAATAQAGPLLQCDGDGGATWSTTGVDPYEWSAAFPQGCSCLETDATAGECKYFDCDCICDLTAGACDANCCCDPECSEEAVARFEALDACLEEGPLPASVVMCYKGGGLDKINPSFPMKAVDTATAAIDGLLCVSIDNSPSKGAFIKDPGSLGSSAFTSSVLVSTHTYADNFDSVSVKQEGSVYEKGYRIPAGFSPNDDGELVAAYGGFLPLPNTGADGSCSEVGAPMLFQETVIERKCLRVAASPDGECESAFGAARLSSDLYVGSAANVVPDSTPSEGDFLPVTISAVTWRNWDTGEEYQFTDRYNCDAYWFDGNDPASAAIGDCNVGGVSGTVTLSDMLTSDPSSIGPGCRNALVGACYTVTHDSEGAIVDVSVELTITDVPSNDQQSLSAEQSFTSQFSSSTTPERSEDAGNQVMRMRSGNPGYIVGSPVLLGGRTDDGQGDLMVVPQRGLSLEGGGGSCDQTENVVVGFGYDLMTCCSYNATKPELEQACNGEGPLMSSGGFIPQALTRFNVSNTFLGSYGNADPADVSQWEAVRISEGTSTQSWNEDAGTCSGVTNSLNMRIMYARVGSEGNRQAKIVAAEADYGKGDWVWVEGLEQESQLFSVCSIVSFYEHESSKAVYSPPPPPIGLKLPYDVFYPFHIESAGASGIQSKSHLALVAYSWASVALALVLLF